MRRLINRVIDTRKGIDDHYYGGSVAFYDGNIQGWHVTDDPDNVLRAIVKGNIILPDHERRELGPGIYISAIPRYWGNRSRRRYDHLNDRRPSVRKALADLALSELHKARQSGYITDSEHRNGIRHVEAYLDGGEDMLLYLSMQPYNIKLDDQAKMPLGVTVHTVKAIEIRAEGRFVVLKRDLRNAEWKRLSRTFDGAVKPASMSSNAESVIWNPNAVVWVGEPTSIDEL